MAIHGMIDLETLGTTPDSVILTIGGVKFDPLDKNKEPHSDFYMKFEIEEQSERSRTTSDDTMAWWEKQPPCVIEEAFGDDNRHSVEEVLAALKTWFVGCDKVWAQGICFDIGAMENILRQYEMPVPWQFYQVEDARTIINRMIRDPRKDMDFPAHHALEDCKAQAKALQIAFDHFGFTK